MTHRFFVDGFCFGKNCGDVLFVCFFVCLFVSGWGHMCLVHFGNWGRCHS